MYKVSTKWVNQLNISHRELKFVLEIRRDNDYYVSVPIEEGDVQVDLQDNIRRDFSATIVDTDGTWTPREVTDELMPFGTICRIRGGFIYSDGTEELVPMGMFRITETNTHYGDRGLEINISGMDLAQLCQEESSKPLTLASNMTVTTAIRLCVVNRFPEAAFDMADTIYTVPNLFFPAGHDLWSEARKLAEGIGMELSFDASGICQVQPMHSAEERWLSLVYDTSKSDSVVTDNTRNFASDRVPNGIVVVGDHSSLASPVRGEAWDMDSRSPTYRFGDYGEISRTIRSEVVRSNTQAKAAAVGILDKSIGPSDMITFNALPNYAHDAGDIIRCNDTTIGASGLYLMANIGFPLNSDGDMTVTAWRRIDEDG